MSTMSKLSVPPFLPEGIIGRPVQPYGVPRHILVLRFHAFGDAVITIPVLAGLRRCFPHSTIEVVTSAQYAPLFSALPFLDRVHAITPDGPKIQRIRTLWHLLPQLGSPDLVLDLQRSRLSQLLRQLLRPNAWTGFDRYAPEHALERYLAAVRWAGLQEIHPIFSFPLSNALQNRTEERFNKIVGDEPEAKARPLICLNPAGCWGTKNWPPERYAALGKRLIREFNARILLLGTENVRRGAQIIAQELGEGAINLVGQTSPLEALALVRRLALMVSDDSGLMHLAWTNGVPTLGIFGASRGVWSRPWGEHTRFLGSEDLPCGACMSENCLRTDRICLARVSVEHVFALCVELLNTGTMRA